MIDVQLFGEADDRLAIQQNFAAATANPGCRKQAPRDGPILLDGPVLLDGMILRDGPVFLDGTILLKDDPILLERGQLSTVLVATV